MSLVHELAASVQCCFELFGTQSDGVLLSKHDQGILNEVSSILQPVLLRLQKQAVVVAESSELFAEDEQLLGAVGEREGVERQLGLKTTVQRAVCGVWPSCCCNKWMRLEGWGWGKRGGGLLTANRLSGCSSTSRVGSLCVLEGWGTIASTCLPNMSSCWQLLVGETVLK